MLLAREFIDYLLNWTTSRVRARPKFAAPSHGGKMYLS